MTKLFLYIVSHPEHNAPLAGLTPEEWLIRGAGSHPYRVIAEEAEAICPKDCAYLAVIHTTTPLVTAPVLLSLVEEMEKRGSSGMEIGRGGVYRADAYRRGILPKRRLTSALGCETTDPRKRSLAEKELYRRNAELSVQNGAIIPDVDSVRIDALSRVEEGATIEPYTLVERSVVRRGAYVGSGSEIRSSEIGEGARIRHAIVEDSLVGRAATIGPFAYIRARSVIGDGCRIGDFVEIKKSILGKGVKAAHLAYVGDATVGAETNVGCGAVFANYDGREKREICVGERVFLGANCNLVAPVSIGDDSYIAAATTVTKEVPAGAFVIGRVRAENREKKGRSPS